MTPVEDAEPDVEYAQGAAGPVAYRDTGPGHPDAMVFVHGINMASAVWDRVIARLAPYRCIALDLRGHGLSVKRGPYSVDGYLDDVAAVLAATDVENAQLVGVSVGGLLSCAFAYRHPELVRSVVAFGTAFVGQHAGLDAGMARLREIGVAEYFAGALPLSSLPPNVTDEVRESAVEMAVTGREDVTMVEEITRSVFLRDLAHLVPGPVARPVLVVNGEYDLTCPPEGGRQLAAAVGAQWRLLAGAGHVIPLERPAECADLLVKFYRETSGGTAAASLSGEPG